MVASHYYRSLPLEFITCTRVAGPAHLKPPFQYSTLLTDVAHKLRLVVQNTTAANPSAWWPAEMSLRLRELVKSPSAPSLSRQTLYVPSYEVKVEQLHYITVKWEYQYRYYSETVEWAKMTETLWTLVILLSFGTLVWRPRTGIERCIEDKNRTFGLLRALLRSLYDFFASPEEPCTCYEFVDGSPEDLAFYFIQEFKESRNECLLFSSEISYYILLNNNNNKFIHPCDIG